MGRDSPSLPPVCVGAGGSSSGQKRKAVVMDDGGGGEDDVPPSWLSLGSMDYGDATDDVDDSSCTVSATMTTTVLGAVSGSSSPAPAADADDTAVAAAASAPILASATAGEFLADHHANGSTGGTPMAAAAFLFTGDDDGVGDSISPFLNSFPPSTSHAGSSSSSLHHHHHHPSIRRRSNAASTASSRSSSGGDAATADDDAGNILPNPPYPWATNKLAKLRTLADLSRRGIIVVEGETKCRRCDKRKVKTYNINDRFQDLIEYFLPNHGDMNDRASEKWMNPTARDCIDCGQKNCVRPVIHAEKERINWLFLLLDETLGFCTLDQLKFLCEHTKRHRTGAKDRLLFSAYKELCNQLVPGIMHCDRKNSGHEQLMLR